MRHSGSSDRYMNWIYLFAGGFLLGIFLMNIGKSFFLNEEGILNSGALSRLKYLDVDSGALFRYVLRERIGVLLFLIVLATTFIGIAASYLLVLWQGVIAGMFITASTIRFGMKGILLILAGMFPQQLLLVPAWIMLLNWCCQICCKFYYPHKDYEAAYKNKNHYFIRKGIMILWIIGVVIIGCILECYVNPMLMSELLNIF